MAIKVTSKKIHFTPFVPSRGRQVDTDPAPTVTLTKGKLLFGPKIIEELQMNKKFVQFAYDQAKSVIGFRIRENPLNLEELKDWKLVNQNEDSKFWSVQLSKIIEAVFGATTLAKKYKAPVQKYRESSGLDKGQIYYYIELSVENEVEQKEKETPAAK